MNEIKLIKEAFSFLLENGYAVSVKKSNIEYCVTYSTSDKQIVLNYDLRLHQFDIGVQTDKVSSDYVSYVSLLEMNVGDSIQKKQLIDVLKVLYHEVETDWTISKRHFSEIINAYAEFVKGNLPAIMSHQ